MNRYLGGTTMRMKKGYARKMRLWHKNPLSSTAARLGKRSRLVLSPRVIHSKPAKMSRQRTRHSTAFRDRNQSEPWWLSEVAEMWQA
eukprot:scaffold212004_cov36-Tisochrysis_lutea.AAC.1